MNNQNGSIFFYILLGVALFAALSFAVTQSIRGTGDADSMIGGSEKYVLATSEIAQYMESIFQTVFQLTNMNGITDRQMDFRNNIYKLSNGSDNTNNNNASCSDSTCRVFAPYNGTGVQPMIFTNGIDTATQSNAALPQNGHGQVWQVIVTGVGTTAPDLVFLIHGISPSLCNVYNQKQGLTTSYTNSTTLTSIGETPASSKPATFAGTFNTTNEFGDGATSFRRKKSFCAPAYADADTSRLAIWHVVRAR